MTAQWLNHLKALKMEIDTNQLSIESVPASDNPNRYYPLLHQGIISVSGPDAGKFLQGQLSCDIKQVDASGSRLGAHCNIKGHMISLYRVMHADVDTYWLRTDRRLMESALSALKRYIIFSKAEAKECSETLAGIGISGPDASSLVNSLIKLDSDETDSVSKQNGMVAVSLPGNRFEIWFPVQNGESVLAQLSTKAAAGTTNAWVLSEIQAGIPDLRPETSEGFIPQMTNLQVFEGVSFTKGCYTGQEIVTRLQHRGQLKRPMYRARVISERAPEPGMAIHAQSRDNQGQVLLCAATSAPQEFELLAVMVKDRVEQEPMLLGSPAREVLEILDLPYQLDKRLFESKR
ncbi:YgfZ/GcvT domain-containing protein [Nitrincola alkalilacustris]|uniref:CAF17-like 4Fe-4S cluster assembly/insertion protein YgfZ n=1 Tax=Nitrincola alkalilacustris TaxID=1571224 RepID=UPI00124DC917|nr:folate-binding protein YgfZ [Nitrincola alkalilacustris]